MPLVVNPYKKKPPKVENAHIISRFYLNKFADSHKSVWVFESAKSPYRKSTRSLCVESGYFEYEVGGHISEGRYESFLAGVEDKAAKIYWKLLAGKQLSNQEIAIWSGFVATMFLRTKKVRNQLGSSVYDRILQEWQTEESLAKAQHDLFKQGHLISRNEISNSIKKVAVQISANPGYLQLHDLENRWQNIAMEIAKKGWQTLEVAPGMSFITSDCPVVTMRIDSDFRVDLGHGFGKEDVAVLFPISPRRLFIASPRKIVWTPTLDTQNTLLFNRAIAQFADKQIIAKDYDKRFVDLANTELGKVIFGANAFVKTAA